MSQITNVLKLLHSN